MENNQFLPCKLHKPKIWPDRAEVRLLICQIAGTTVASSLPKISGWFRSLFEQKRRNKQYLWGRCRRKPCPRRRSELPKPTEDLLQSDRIRKQTAGIRARGARFRTAGREEKRRGRAYLEGARRRGRVVAAKA